MIDKIEEMLKKIIDQKGFIYINENPYEIYSQAISDYRIDKPYARALLLMLLAIDFNYFNYCKDDIYHILVEQCFLNETISLQLAKMYSKLMSKENIKQWKQEKGKGFLEFCHEIFKFEFSDGDYQKDGNVYVNWDVQIVAEFKVVDETKVHALLQEALTKNPFLTKEDINDQVLKYLSKIVQKDLDEYIYDSEEDYYPLDFETYEDNCDYLLNEFANKHGFELISVDCDGDVEYEPISYRYY